MLFKLQQIDIPIEQLKLFKRGTFYIINRNADNKAISKQLVSGWKNAIYGIHKVGKYPSQEFKLTHLKTGMLVHRSKTKSELIDNLETYHKLVEAHKRENLKRFDDYEQQLKDAVVKEIGDE